jgi:Gas vesicle synthesis protein GvpL/GvpF
MPGAYGTYIYGLVQSARAPSLARVPDGLAGAKRPRALRAGPNRWIVAADVPLDRYGEEALERGLRDLDWVASCAMAHEAVVEHLARRAPVVPMKLFTIFLGDTSALEHLDEAKRKLDRAFRRIAGAAEWSVRIFRATPASERTPRLVAVRSGAEFLRLKKTARDRARASAASAATAVEGAHRALKRIAKDTRLKPPVEGNGARLLLDGAYLVADARQSRFRAAAKRQAAQCKAAGCTLTLTGPWPAYHFIEGTP